MEEEALKGGWFEPLDVFTIYQARYLILKAALAANISETEFLAYDLLRDGYKKEFGQELDKDEIYKLFGTRKIFDAMSMMHSYFDVQVNSGALKLKLKMPMDDCMKDVQELMAEDDEECFPVEEAQIYKEIDKEAGEKLYKKLFYNGYKLLTGDDSLDIDSLGADLLSSVLEDVCENHEEDSSNDSENLDVVEPEISSSKDDKLLKVEFSDLKEQFFKNYLPMDDFNKLKIHCPPKIYSTVEKRVNEWEKYEKESKIYFERQFKKIKKILTKDETDKKEKYFTEMKKFLDEIEEELEQRKGRFEEWIKPFNECFQRYIPGYKKK